MSGLDAAENMERSTEINTNDTTIIDNFNKQKSILAVDGVPQNEEGLKILMVSHRILQNLKINTQVNK
jgi:hypothetical protein